MSDTPVDTSKRTWLIASGCAGAAGGVAAVVPFVSSFQPSERAKAAGAAVEVDISAIQPGEKLTVEWRGKPVWIMRRTPAQLEGLTEIEGQLADPSLIAKRSQHPITLKTSNAQSNPSCLWPLVFVLTWVVRLAIDSKQALSPPCLMTGTVASFELVTAIRLT